MSLAWSICLLALVQETSEQKEARQLAPRYTIHGDVSIEGYGSAGPSATVSSTCGGIQQTNHQGNFALSGFVSNQGAATCSISVSAPGCDSKEVIVGVPAGGGSTLVAVVLKPTAKGPSSGTTSFLSLAAPQQVHKLREQARKHAAQKKLAEARRGLERAVALHDRDPEAWHELGLVLKQLGDDAQARAAFEKSSTTDRRFAPPLVQLELLALRRQDWPAAIQAGRAAVALNPTGLPEAWLYLSTAYLKLNSPAEAEDAARRALDSSGKAGLAKAHHLLGVALAAQGRRPEAIIALKQYLAAAPGATDAAMVTEHIGMLEKQ